jgi:hypothetical protein
VVVGGGEFEENGEECSSLEEEAGPVEDDEEE